jgi:hypothetical protein
MTAPGGDHGEPYPARPEQPWPQYQHPPVDPQAPVNYPEYPPAPPYSGPQPPPYGPIGYGGPPPPPPYGGPIDYGRPPLYPGPYDPYQAYQANQFQTNGLAIASLVTSIAGVLLGVPLAVFCYLGWLIPVAGAAMGGVALNQIKRTNQPGRGLAIAGVAIGSATAVLLVLTMVIFAAAMTHSTTFLH